MATQRPSDVLAHFVTLVANVTSETPDDGFKASAYRFRLEDEGWDGVDGTFYVDMPSTEAIIPLYGATETTWRSVVNVDVAYLRPGGDMGEGDRQTVNRNAADDMQRLADVLPIVANYSSSTTGIRTVTFTGFSRVVDGKAVEIWRCAFLVTWRSDTLTA